MARRPDAIPLVPGAKKILTQCVGLGNRRKACSSFSPRLRIVFLLLSMIGLLISGCHRQDNPNKVYEQIVQTVRHGDLNSSLTEVDKAIKENTSQSVEWHWRFRVLKAQILISRSAFQEALDLLHEDLPPPLHSTDIAVRKKLMEGTAYRNGQSFEMAERNLNESLALAKSSQPHLVCEPLKAIGELQVDEKKYVEAGASFRLALELARRENRQDQVASDLVDLARLATSEEHFGESIDRNQQALELARRLDMQGIVATILGNTAWSYYELGDYERSLASFKEAASVSERIGQTGYSFYWLTGVANSYIALNDPSSARSILLDTLTRARQLQDTATITLCLNALSEISLNANRLDEATTYDQQALEIEHAGLDHFETLRSTLLAGRIETSRRHFAQAEQLLQTVLQDPQAETSVRWEADARLAKLHDDEGLAAKAQVEYQHAISTIESARSAITQPELQLSFLAGGIEFYDDYIEFLIAHHKPLDALKVAELSRAQTLEEGLGPSAKHDNLVTSKTQLQSMARQLRATLLFYWVGSRHSYLWAITPMAISNFALPPSSNIDPLVKSYREAAANSEDVAVTRQSAGEQLYAMLVEPAQKLIPQNSRVILLPDASLYSLNFETLIVPTPKPHFWIEDATLTTANSLSMLAAGVNRPFSKQKSLLLVGDAPQASAEFESLPHAEDEMHIVESYFKNADLKVLRREQATPAAYFASHPEHFAYLHFVTHGTASRARPLDSAVILGKEPGTDSYKLYARDIVSRHLNAELVTISACNGSGTRSYSGEGLVGLSWAFLRAGAHNVIGALWEVSNAPATPQLMNKLYDGLDSGEDPAAALRAAKLSLLHSADVFRKPYYWAPFQLYAGS